MRLQLLLFIVSILLINMEQIPHIQSDISPSEKQAITIAVDYGKGLSNISETLINQIKTELSSEGLQAVFISADAEPNEYEEAFNFDMPTSANINLSIQQFQNNLYFSIFPYTSPMSKISPILEMRYIKTSTIIFKESEITQITDTAINLATGLALYSIGACDQMGKYLKPVSDGFIKPTNDFQDRLVKSIQFYKANCNLVARNYTAAIPQFKDALLYFDTLPGETGSLVGAALNLAWTYIQIGETQQAIDLMTQLVNDIESLGEWFSLQPMQANRYLQRSEIYNLLGRYSDALADLNSVLDIQWTGDILQARYHVKRGQTYLLLYEWDNVLADYNQAIELDPTYADAYFYRGVLKYSILQTGQSLYPEALADFQHYLDLSPNGDHAADATRYATNIQTQLTALNK